MKETDIQSESSKTIVEKDKKPKKKNKSMMKWAFKSLILTAMLAFVFSIISETVLSETELIMGIIITIIFILINATSDMLAAAITTAELKPFLAMAAKKVNGAKECVLLVKNADKISNIISDMVGDICGIMSGAVGASLVLQIAVGGNLWVSVIMSTVISAFTVSFKSIGKYLALNYYVPILLFVGKVMRLLHIGSKGSKDK